MRARRDARVSLKNVCVCVYLIGIKREDFEKTNLWQVTVCVCRQYIHYVYPWPHQKALSNLPYPDSQRLF